MHYRLDGNSAGPCIVVGIAPSKFNEDVEQKEGRALIFSVNQKNIILLL